MTSWVARLFKSRDTAPRPTLQPPVSQADSTVIGAPFQDLVTRADEALLDGQYDKAVTLLNDALALRHDAAEVHYKLGVAFKRQQSLEEAADCFLMALCFAPQLAEAHYALALIERSQEKFDNALASVTRAIECGMRTAYTYNLQGALFTIDNDIDAAVTSFEHAIAIDPNDSIAHSNLGYTLFRDRGEYTRGAQHIEHALELNPENPVVQCNYTTVLSHRGRLEETIEICDRLLAAQPEMYEMKLNRGLALLNLGRFDQGWVDYEARKLVRCNYVPRHFPCLAWAGEDIGDKTVLIHGEQGLGDEIMFASCFTELIERASQCVIECEARLVRLFQRSFPSARVFAGVQSKQLPAWWSQAPAIDLTVSAGTLPMHFRRTLAAFPKHDGYLRADLECVQHWRGRLAALGPGVKVGISWRGGLRNTRREVRSIQLSDWVQLFGVGSAQFISLQYGDTVEERARLEHEHGLYVHHWQEAIDDLDETAALVKALDLVISVTTAVIHLAGALGQQVWILTPICPEWRYQARGETMPWYPSARLIRQPVEGDWRSVIEVASSRLREFTAQRDL